MDTKLKEMISQRGRDSFYNFYRELGYDEKTAAVLTLFTYGRYPYNALTLEGIYEALISGEEYVPEEVREERRRMEELRRAREERERARRAREAEARCAFPDSASISGAISKAAEMFEEEGLADCIRESAPEPRAIGIGRRASIGTGLNNLRKAIFSAADSGDMDKGMPLEAPSFLKSDKSFTMSTGAPTGMSAPTGVFANAMPSPAAPSPAASAGRDFYAGFATDEYATIEEKEARSTVVEPTSTFRMTTNTASAGVILNQLRSGRRIDKNMVRIEEMMNYFRYDAQKPVDEMFSISCEMMDSEKTGKNYLYIHVQGKEEVKEKQNIVILLDVSGSMSSNTEVTQAMVAAIISKLGNGDRLSLVTYSSRDKVELNAVQINGEADRIKALEKLLSIRISGITDGSSGINRAYKIGKENFIEGGNNQVILITDGDLNFGITDKGGLEELIEEKKKENIFLSVIGTGLWNFKDDKLEVLSKHGNGVYRTVNNLADVSKSIDKEYASLVNIIAKDVKAQVEFNPEVVETYRLLGFENRALGHEDFVNDKVISEPFGSGGYGVALYELAMKKNDSPVESGLKYSKIVTTGSAEPGTVKIRYKEPLGESSIELEKVIETAQNSYTDNLRLAFVVYVCSEKLRGSDKITDNEIALAKQLYAELGEETRRRNSADLFKLAGMLEKTGDELGIGIHSREPFPW